ncbi:hypothetical protein TrRE_jg8808 [Triparma retinervis]|uniref:Treble clef zinc finger domain-containing protein n=1 Tax=Triparma retinervis TaxID=2557542 RepID=A0A9W7G6U4_9STRA|nr:hypothetical protein TrRE_jg8808 [Triparma retinervis]
MKSIAVPSDSKLPIWWKCNKGPDHEWQSTISKRLDGEGCRCCLGIKLSVTNSIAVLRPDVAELWSKTRNIDKAKPDKMMLTAKYAKVWFECPKGEDHVWELNLEDALKDGGLECPCCAGKKLSITNCLLTVRPDIAEMWLVGGGNAERKPDGIMAEADGTGWLSWEGREWEIYTYVLGEGGDGNAAAAGKGGAESVISKAAGKKKSKRKRGGDDSDDSDDEDAAKRFKF